MNIKELLEKYPKLDDYLFTPEDDWDDENTYAVNCNDLWAWACADAEDVTDENAHELDSAIIECDGDLGAGTTVFACRKRGCRPQGGCYSYYDEKYWPLLNETGPVREVNNGNPYEIGEYHSGQDK